MESISVAGIDVHKRMLAVVVGRQGMDEKQWERRKFGSTTKELLHEGLRPALPKHRA